MKLEWTKAPNHWFGICGKYRAEIHPHHSKLIGFVWRTSRGLKSGSSGSAHSVQQAKRLAERFTNEMAEK